MNVKPLRLTAKEHEYLYTLVDQDAEGAAYAATGDEPAMDQCEAQQALRVAKSVLVKLAEAKGE